MINYACSICGFIYNEAAGYPEGDISTGTGWDELPSGFVCPLCGASKSEFYKEVASNEQPASPSSRSMGLPEDIQYSPMQLSALFSNLAKGCEKQYDMEMSELYSQMSSYYESKQEKETTADWQSIQSYLDSDLTEKIEYARSVAQSDNDRGALRALKWTEQVSRMINSHLKKLSTGATDRFKDKNVFVCDICGFIFVGDEKPEVCPVCKVPNMKMSQIKRGA